MGEVLVAQRLHGPPMSFMHKGKAIYRGGFFGGRDNDDELLVFALPED